MGADQVVLLEPTGTPSRSSVGAGEVLSRQARPVVVVEVSVPRMRLQPGLRVPIGAGRARVLWFDRRHERDLVVRAVARSGWAVRARRWPFVLGGVLALVLAALTVTVSWLATLVLLCVAGGCVLHLVRNEQGARAARGGGLT